MKHIGILAHSADGAGLCFLEMVRESARRLGAHAHPEITLSILPMGEVLPAWDANDLPPIGAYLARSATRLASAGCVFFVCPDNTAHIAFEHESCALPLPALHIAEIVTAAAEQRGHRHIGLLGTKYTMDGPVYRAAAARRDLKLSIPPAAERALVDHMIFEELCHGELKETSRQAFVRIIEGLEDAGADCVALSCTEIPLLITPAASPLPTLDSTRLLAHAAVDVALGARPLPEWRGGPLR